MDFYEFRIDGLNRLNDLISDDFGRATNDFMQAVGEDNIFMSGFDWLPENSNLDKRKYVRSQIDEIMCQIFNMQTEINQPRDTSQNASNLL